MRLLRLGPSDELILTKDLVHDIPPYAILSHTWGQGDNDEVVLKDVIEGHGKDKPGYQKILFCGRQALDDGLEYFWVDTCCIDKTSSAELTEAINSMFRWYEKAEKCYAFLADVSCSGDDPNVQENSAWQTEFRNSRWHTRGWTLQELLAPRNVEFFSSEGVRLGDRRSLEQTIFEITRIPLNALQGTPLSKFGFEERISWSRNRRTLKPEDLVYSLLGILGVSLPLVYGEGLQRAFERLRHETSVRSTLYKVLGKLPVAQGAPFDSHAEEHNPRCMENTRVDLMRDLVQWTAEPTAKPIFWLNGMAGTGKSTISRTFAHILSESGNLGASFFFKRGEDDCGVADKFFTTIASDFAKRLPETAAHIQSAIVEDPAIFTKAMKEQLEKLIIQPLSYVSDTTTKLVLVVVVDALDECSREEDAMLLIRLLSSIKQPDHVSLRFFLTSRPELSIRLGFDAIHGTYESFILHTIDETVIGHDITIFYENELQIVRRDYNRLVPTDLQLPDEWPDPRDLNVLVKMTIPLFVFAATICRFIANRRMGNPDEQLHEVLRYETKSQESQLDATYLPVLNQSIARLTRRQEAEVLARFQKVVGSIVILATPLPARELALLLNTSISQVMSALETLHSVLSVPTSPSEPVRLFHLSFRDFLVDPGESENPFWVDEKKTHAQIAAQCLRVLNDSLHRDLCEVHAPGAQRSSLDPSRIDEKLPPHVQYACRFWSYHLKEAQMSISDKDEVYEFLISHFLHWLEALAWLGRIMESLQAIKIAHSLLKADTSWKMNEFLIDASRFVLSAGSIFQISPLQIYSSAMIFAPSTSIIRSNFESEIPDWLLLKPRVLPSWDRTLQTLEGHLGIVTSCTFALAGHVVASVSQDRTVRLWDSNTGAPLLTLEGHSDRINSIACSPNGKLLATASDDKTIRLWAADTGAHLQTFEGHEDRVNGVAFSPDGAVIASASWDKTVRFWALAGAPLKILTGHDALVKSVAFSPDGSTLVSASWDNTIRSWDVNTGAQLKILEGHDDRVNSIAFSPDGRTLASGSDDNTVRLWSAETGAQLQTLKGHNGGVNCVAFSPHGRILASTSWDKTIRLWSSTTGATLQILQGHGNLVSSAAFSPDCETLASTSWDKTVRLWAVDEPLASVPDSSAQFAASDINAPLQPLEFHSSLVNSVVLSPDATIVASASWDKSIRFWTVDTGALLRTLDGHENRVNSIVFSPDGMILASASWDKTVRFWAVDTGDLLWTLEGHSDVVSSVTFAPNGKMVASSSWDKSVRLWAVDTRTELLITLNGHDDRVNSVAFSPSGTIVASASDDETVRLWAVDTGIILQILRYQSYPADAVQSPLDSSATALTSWEKTIRLWAAGRTVASASWDKTVQLWAPKTGAPLQTLEGHGDLVNALAFSPDETKLALASWDERLRLWTVDTGMLVLTLNLGTTSHTISFDAEAHIITTDAGKFSLHPRVGSSEEPEGSHPSVATIEKQTEELTSHHLKVGYGFSKDRKWITHNGMNMLWLPADCRPVCCTIRGCTVVIGSGSGKVLVLRFRT